MKKKAVVTLLGTMSFFAADVRAQEPFVPLDESAIDESSGPGTANAFGTRVEDIRSRVDRRRTKVEAVALRGGGGNYGGFGTLGLFTLRWHRFYVELARFTIGGGVRSGHRDKYLLAGMGVAAGLPIHLDYSGRHEIRVGVGLVGGTMRAYSYCATRLQSGYLTEEYCEYRQLQFGFIAAPEVYYVFHASDGVAVQLGIELYLATTANSFFRRDGAKERFVVPPPALSGFLGLRF